MDRYPRLHESKDSVVVEFAPELMHPTDVRAVPMVLDFGESGEVLGIEIISLKFHAGNRCLEIIEHSLPTEGENLAYAYDDSCDCFSLQLRAGRSADQKSLVGDLWLDRDGRIIGIRLQWRSEPEG